MKISVFLFCFCSCVSSVFSGEKVLIFTYSYNRPDFIEIQEKTFKKFLKEDYEFVVFNDATTDSSYNEIHETCKSLNLRCIDIPQEIHSRPYLQRFRGENLNHPAVRNANVVQYSLDVLGFQHDGILALFDSDLFLVKDFSIVNYMNGSAIAGIPQLKKAKGREIEYLWIGMVFCDLTKMPDRETLSFNCGLINDVPVDAGGFSYFYLHNHPELSVKRIHHALRSPFEWCKDCEAANITPCLHNTNLLMQVGCTEAQIAFIHSGPMSCEFFERTTFFHYRGGTNWDNQTKEFHNRKTDLLNTYIESILSL